MRRLALVFAVGVLSASFGADAQQPGKVSRIGVLGYNPPTSPESSRFWHDGFLRGLRDLGYVEGQNIVIEWRYWEGRVDRLPALTAELVRLKVEVIVVGPTPAAEEARRATSTIPIVTVHGDPVGSGLVASLARPGGNITGLSLTNPELVSKQLQLLTEAIPGLSRVAVLSNPATSTHPLYLREAGVAARSLGVRLQVLKARTPSDFAGAFSAATNEQAGALLLLGDSTFFVERARLADLAARRRLPMMGVQPEYAEAGSLLAYGVSVRDTFRRLAAYVDRILKGAKPGDLPIEQATQFELAINVKTARALGLTIPESMLQRADKVIGQ